MADGHGAWSKPPQEDVPPVPTSSYSHAPLSPTLSHADFGGAPEPDLPLSTLDEPVWETIKRDLVRIGANLVLVVFPFKNWDQQTAALRNWDLWGPMAFTLTLAITLSLGSHQAPTVFSPDLPLSTLDEPVWETIKRDLVRIGANLVLVVFPFKNWDQQTAALRNWDLWGPMLVFGVCAAGAVVLTVNANLLGGNIGFFQSMCLLGYCLFPLDIAAIVTAFVSNVIARWVVVVAAVAWAAWASMPFMGGSVPPARRALAVYPLLLLYTAMGWLALVKA